jgi:hypothetical protein
MPSPLGDRASFVVQPRLEVKVWIKTGTRPLDDRQESGRRAVGLDVAIREQQRAHSLRILDDE